MKKEESTEGVELDLDIINPLKRSNAFQLIHDLLLWFRSYKNKASSKP